MNIDPLLDGELQPATREQIEMLCGTFHDAGQRLFWPMFLEHPISSYYLSDVVEEEIEGADETRDVDIEFTVYAEANDDGLQQPTFYNFDISIREPFSLPDFFLQATRGYRVNPRTFRVAISHNVSITNEEGNLVMAPDCAMMLGPGVTHCSDLERKQFNSLALRAGTKLSTLDIADIQGYLALIGSSDEASE